MKSALQQFVLAYRPRLDLSVGYVKQLLTSVRRLEDWHGGRLTPSDFSAELLTAFLADYCAGHAARTVNSKRQALLTLWRFAYRQGRCANPPGEVAKAREPRRIPVAWTITEVERLLAECRRQTGLISGLLARYWWPSLVLVIYDTGCRIGAMRQARCIDFSAGEHVLLVRAEHMKGCADRLYWLSDQTTVALAGMHATTRELLWPWPYHRRTFWTKFRRIVEGAGLSADRRGMSLFHKLRRTNLSYCAAVDLELARAQAGHASSAMTLRHYIDPRIAKTRSAVDVLPRPGD